MIEPSHLFLLLLLKLHGNETRSSCDQRLFFLSALRALLMRFHREPSVSIKKYIYPLHPRVYGSLNGLDVTIDGVYIPLFVTFYNIFAKII